MNEFYINQLNAIQEEMNKMADILMNGEEVGQDDDLIINFNGKNFRIQFTADVYENKSK